MARRAARSKRRRAGFTLLEVLAALGLVGAVGVLATGGGHALARLGHAAKTEAVGLAAAERKLEELLSLETVERRGGNDDLTLSGLSIRRIWRVVEDTPAQGLTRIEVSVSWESPSLVVLTLVGVAP